jgi:CRP-like cAMP-binding protein
MNAEAVGRSVEEQIATIPLFAGLRPAALRMIAEIVVEETHLPGTVIFKQGDVGEKLYFVVAGRVRMTRDAPGKSDEEIASIGPGETFGEMALFDGESRPTDARAAEDCVLLAIHRDAFEDLLFVHKELAYEVLWNVIGILGRRVRELSAGR